MEAGALHMARNTILWRHFAAAAAVDRLTLAAHILSAAHNHH